MSQNARCDAEQPQPAVQHSHGSSLLASASLVVTVGVTCSWPLGATGARGTEDRSCLHVCVGLGQHRGGIVIAVGQDEYDAIDAADQVTPELITSTRAGLGGLWRRSVIQPVHQSSVSGRPCFPGCMVGFCLSLFGFRAPKVYSKHPRASCPRAERLSRAKKAVSWPKCQN